jgi:hypothetical protein
MRLSFRPLILTAFVLTVLLLPASADAGKKTHLGVPIGDLVSLETLVVPNDNSSGHQFFYDRTGPAFSVPDKWSLVVTDIAIQQNSGTFSSSDLHLVVINFGLNRSMFLRWTGGGGFYRSMTTGIVIPPGSTPTVRNTDYSTYGVIVQIEGYLVKGEGLPDGAPRF